MVQRLSLLRHRQRYLTHFAKYFMELLFDSTAALDRIPVLQDGRRRGSCGKKVWKMCENRRRKKGEKRRGKNRGNPQKFPGKKSAEIPDGALKGSAV